MKSLAIMFSCIALCGNLFAAPGLVLSSGGDAVAELDGRAIITESDISDFQAARACYGADAQTARQAAFLRLLEAEIAEEAMRRHHGPVFSDRELDDESARIDRESKAPVLLQCIKKHFEKAPKRYRSIFVRPTLIESRFRLFIRDNPAVQEPSRRQAEKIRALFTKGDSFESLASQFQLAYSSAVYSASVTAGEDPKISPENEFIQKNLKNLSPGQASPKPLESDVDFKLIRLLKKDGWKYQFEFVSVPKLTQEQWLSSITKMTLVVHDPDLAAWIRSIKGNPRLLAVKS